MSEEKSRMERAAELAAQVTSPDYRQQPVSAQAAIIGAVLTALLGAAGGGAITFGGDHDHSMYVEAEDLTKLEAKVDRIDDKVDKIDGKIVELRVSLAAAGVTTPQP